MAIVLKNTYNAVSNRDLTNLSVCVDIQRLGMDETEVIYSGGNYLVKVGSIIEANGSLYSVTGSDISLTPANGVIVFDSFNRAFSISALTYSYDPQKCGYYIDGQPTWRVTRFSTDTLGNITTTIFGVKTASVTFYKTGTFTSGQWFDAFASYLQNIGQTAFSSGTFAGPYYAMKMERTSLTAITVTVYSGSTVSTVVFTSGNATSILGSLAI